MENKDETEKLLKILIAEVADTEHEPYLLAMWSRYKFLMQCLGAATPGNRVLDVRPL